MVAYRAETALANQIKSDTIDTSDARQLILDLCVTKADILPDQKNNLLLVRVHGASRPVVNRTWEKLFDTLNEAKIIYPGTNMKLRYEIGANLAGG